MPEVIKTKPATPAYREGWERVFGKQDKPDHNVPQESDKQAADD